jgi:DNA polymerase III alpha subunit
MNIDKFGRILLSQDEFFSHLYSGQIKNYQNIFLNDAETDKFNSSLDKNKDNFSKLKKYVDLDISTEEFDKNNQINWFMPKNYCPELIEQLYLQCNSVEETNRVTTELELFAQYNMIDLLYYLKYLIDTMRKHNIVWGVGRGSSVASFVLYLIGVHKINSIKYELDIHEFLK